MKLRQAIGLGVKTTQMAKMLTISFVTTPTDSLSLRRDARTHGEFECNFPSLSNFNMLPQHGGRKNFPLKLFLY